MILTVAICISSISFGDIKIGPSLACVGFPKGVCFLGRVAEPVNFFFHRSPKSYP